MDAWAGGILVTAEGINKSRMAGHKAAHSRVQLKDYSSVQNKNYFKVRLLPDFSNAQRSEEQELRRY